MLGACLIKFNIQYSFLTKEILVKGYIYALEASFVFNSEILRACPLNTGINTYLMLQCYSGSTS